MNLAPFYGAFAKQQEEAEVKKYHVADILTAMRYFFTVIMLILTVKSASPAWALFIFSVGELTDAADGPAAARWPYPAELEQRLWWRRNKVIFDMTADMALGIATLLYVSQHTYPFGRILLAGSLSIGAVTQLLVVFVLPSPDKSRFTKWLVLLRRSLLYIPAILAVIMLLLLKATIPGELTREAVRQSMAFKVWLGIGLTIGLTLIFLKKDRIVEVGRKIQRT